MEDKTTTQLKQSTLWRMQKLIMTHNFTEEKEEVEPPPPPPPPPLPINFEKADEI